MNTLTLTNRRTVLIDLVFNRTLVTDLVLVVSGVLFTALLAHVTIPLVPVPITGQTLAVLLVGASLGMVRGAASLGLYLVLGLIGFPVYAPMDDGGYLTGLAAFSAPSFGYIIGFIPAAAFVGWLSERKWDRKFLKAFATFLGGTVIVFAFGLPWLSFVLKASLIETYQWGLRAVPDRRSY